MADLILHLSGVDQGWQIMTYVLLFSYLLTFADITN